MRVVFRIVMLAFAAISTTATAQCTKDTDCKGDRICVLGECSDAPARPAATPPTTLSLKVEADRLARVAQLNRELVDLHTELEESSIGSPAIKLATGGVLGVASAILLMMWANSTSCTSDCGGSVIGALGFTAAGAALALLLWGGIQLPLRLNARALLPGEIRAREEQLHVLEAR